MRAGHPRRHRPARSVESGSARALGPSTYFPARSRCAPERSGTACADFAEPRTMTTENTTTPDLDAVARSGFAALARHDLSRPDLIWADHSVEHWVPVGDAVGP